MTDDIRTVLELFQSLTGRLMLSPADHDQAKAWVEAGMPLSVMEKGVRDKMSRCQGKFYTRNMPLAWCDADVREVFVNWRRAVGPRRALQVEERS